MARSIFYFTDSPTFGGAEQALLGLAASLDRRAWSPTLVYHPAPGIAPLVEGARELGIALRPVRPMPLGLSGARRVPAFARELAPARPAVFHAHLSWPLAAKFALASAVAVRVPAVVATVHLFPDFRIDLSNRLQLRLLGAGIGRVIAVSAEIARRLRSAFAWPERKIEVIRNAVETDPFRRVVDPRLRLELAGGRDRPVVLTVARLDRQKGHPYLLEAAARVPDARFVLAGAGPERGALEARATALGLGDRVAFLGHRADVPELLAASDVVVLPSLYEGLPLSLLEAMAAGKPVVASAIPGNDEAVRDGETGLLVPPRDPDALAAAIRTIIGYPALAGRLGAAARASVEERFSLTSMVDSVVAIYEDLLGARVVGA
jgi:glycosyltransferase involved in cell wall biosynthesis